MKILTTTFLLFATVCLSRSVSAGEPVPAIDVTLNIMKGVNYFRAQAATNEDGWLFLPIEGVRVAGWTTNTIRYKLVEVNVPGYKYSDPYEVMVPGNSPTDPMHQVTRYRTVTPDPKQDHKEKRESYDPNGPLSRENYTPVYEKDIGYRWRYGGLGNNALAILALNRCGIRVDDPLINRPAYNLAGIISSFGLPDNTYDLAWMTAAFAALPGDDFKRLTGQCAAKLLDAQITTGPAAGLWGPVAVNPAMTSAFLKTLGKLSETRKTLQLQVTGEEHKKSSGKLSGKATRLEEEIEKIDGRLIELQANSTRFTQLGLLMFDNFGSAQYGLDGWGRRTFAYQADRLSIETLPYLIENQITADLDSTALALYALRVAFENDRLPLQTWRPEIPKVVVTPGAPPAPPVSDFPPARSTGDILALATRALTAARTADGQWNEMNIHQRVTDFTWLKSIPQLGADTTILTQPVTAVSICRGSAALATLQLLQTGKPGPAILETAILQPLIHDLLTGTLTNANGRLPYDMLLPLSMPHVKTGKPVPTDFTAWNTVADWLQHQQTATGIWGRDNQWVMMPSTSLLALRQTLKNITDADLVKMYDKPHLTPPMFAGGNIGHYGAPEASYETANALLFLADGLPDGWSPSPITVSENTPDHH